MKSAPSNERPSRSQHRWLPDPFGVAYQKLMKARRSARPKPASLGAGNPFGVAYQKLMKSAPSNERPSRSQHRQPVIWVPDPFGVAYQKLMKSTTSGQTEASIAGNREPVRSRLSEIDEKRPKQRAA
jgi:predicted 3-demethylubiquinone-9 3-methyltransferase (glyoxalase superfamily)